MLFSPERFTALRQAASLHVAARPYTYGAGFIALIVLGGALVVTFFVPPPSFPTNTVITVPEGASVTETAHILGNTKAIRSPLLFRIVVGDRGVRAGSYRFEEPRGLISLAISIVRGDGGMAPVRVTFPEGITIREMADVLEERIASFDRAAFVATTTGKEGYLFPDTYFFSPFASADDVALKLESTFDERIAELTPLIEVSGHSRSEVVTLASIIEREANTYEDRQVIAGILWKRLSIGMALQVDAVFGYIKGIETYHPTFDDLAIDSPYNTYKYPGLPPTPISNPGMDSLRAAVTPVKTEYLYYLTGTDGVMRYAKTFEEHKQNRAKYLD